MKQKYINPNEYGSLFYGNKEKKYIKNVIKQKRIFRYSKCKFPYSSMCESKINELFNMRYSLLTTNGTSALKTALIGSGVKKGDRVLISSYTFLATALAPISIGAIPIPIEIDLETGLNLDDLKTEIKKGCKAVIVVHFQGRAFNLEKVKKITDKEGIVLIEDACQAFAAKYKNNYAGTMGDIGVFSFQQFKQISSGEGGCVITNNEKYYSLMRNYTDMGSNRDRFPDWNSEGVLFGENYRMNNLVAAVLYAQIEKLPKIIKKQKQSRFRIMNRLIDNKGIIVSKDPDGDTAMNIILLMKDSKAKEIAKKTAPEMNIELRNMWSSLYYDNKLFINNKLDSLNLRNKDCSYSRQIIDRMLVMSVPPRLSLKDEKIMSRLINKLINDGLME